MKTCIGSGRNDFSNDGRVWEKTSYFTVPSVHLKLSVGGDGCQFLAAGRGPGAGRSGVLVLVWVPRLAGSMCGGGRAVSMRGAFAGTRCGAVCVVQVRGRAGSRCASGRGPSTEPDSERLRARAGTRTKTPLAPAPGRRPAAHELTEELIEIRDSLSQLFSLQSDCPFCILVSHGLSASQAPFHQGLLPCHLILFVLSKPIVLLKSILPTAWEPFKFLSPRTSCLSNFLATMAYFLFKFVSSGAYSPIKFLFSKRYLPVIFSPRADFGLGRARGGDMTNVLSGSDTTQECSGMYLSPRFGAKCCSHEAASSRGQCRQKRQMDSVGTVKTDLASSAVCT